MSPVALGTKDLGLPIAMFIQQNGNNCAPLMLLFCLVFLVKLREAFDYSRFFDYESYPIEKYTGKRPPDFVLITAQVTLTWPTLSITTFLKNFIGVVCIFHLFPLVRLLDVAGKSFCTSNW